MSAGRLARGVSSKTGLPRFVIRIRKGGRFYYYFRYDGVRLPLPALDDPGFHASYTMRLVENGLVEKASESMPRQITPQRVYFIEDEAGDCIKIGVARRPRSRLSELQTGHASKLRLIAHVPGGKDLEAELHRRFAAHRIRGEWFERAPAILDEIERLSPPSEAG